MIFFPGAATAQSLIPPAPYSINIKTMNAVNAVTGALSVDSDDIAVGSPDNDSEIRLRRTTTVSDGGIQWNIFGAGHTSSLHDYLSGGGSLNLNGCCTPTYNSSINVSVHGQIYIFGTSGTSGNYTFTDIYGRGAQLNIVNQAASPLVYKMVESDGTTYTFIASSAYVVDANPPPPQAPAYWVSSIDRPSGDRLSFVYEAGRTNSGVTTANRLKSVSNSQGYGLKFTYANPTVGGALDSSKLRISQINAVSSTCDLSNTSCSYLSLYNSSYSYSYIYSNGSPVIVHDYYGNSTYDFYMSSFSDPSGITHSYSSNNQNFYTGSNSVADIAVTMGSTWVVDGLGNERELKEVFSLKDAMSNASNFTYQIVDNTSNSQTDSTVTVTDPSNGTRVYHNKYNATFVAPITNEPLVDWVKDPNGLITSYGYDSQTRLVSVTNPEGDIGVQTLDSRGNATESRFKAKPGSGLADIVTTRYFPACVSTNLKICNKPSYIIDARGNRTDYTYDPAHGGVLTETGPADSSGNRPLTTYQYVSFVGYDGVTFYRLSSKIEKIDATRNRTTTYTYDPANHWSLKQTAVSDGQTTRITCSKYGDNGRLISKTSPNAGLQVCP
jgi:hypothetical protein